VAILAAGCGSVDSNDPAVPNGYAAEPTSTTQQAVSSGYRGTKAGPLAPTGSSNTAVYQGGPVLPYVRVIPVFWGTGQDATVTPSAINAFFAAATDNAYFDWMDEYYTSSPLLGPTRRGFALPSTRITPHNTADIINGPGDIGAELAFQINNGSLAPPEQAIRLSSDLFSTMYIVYFPSTKIVTNRGCGTSCSAWCGCHDSSTQTINGISVNVPFAMVAAHHNCTCGPLDGTTQNDLQNTTMTSYHEMAETITDPFGSGWSNEIGDPCSRLPTTITDINGNGYAAQQLWSNAANACVGNPVPAAVGKCRAVIDAFGVNSNNAGFAPPEVQAWLISNICVLNASQWISTDSCQKASEIYGIDAGNTFGYAPTSVKDWWNANSCGSHPLVPSETLCQRASDTYGINAGVTWGSAPSYVRSWWTAQGGSGCTTRPRSFNPCQKAADFYGIVASQGFGFAPSDVATWWTQNNCQASTTTPMSQLCQNASDLFAIDAGSSFGGAPDNVVTWWKANGCSTHPSCQDLSELFGTSATHTWGYAPTYVQNWWSSSTGHCQTSPLFTPPTVADNCQRASDRFAVVAGQTFGFAPAYVQFFWNVNCQAGGPKNYLMKQFTNGP
jgi:hypothetical protein